MRHVRHLFATSAALKKGASLACCVALLSVCSLARSAAAQNSSASETQTGPIATSAANPALTFNDWVARSTMVVAGNNFDDAMYATPKGNGFDGIAALLIERPEGYFICSGALLAGGLNVLTAAHCLADEQGINVAKSVTAVFFTPGQPDNVREIIGASSNVVNPAYTGEVIDAHDVAIVKLSEAPSLGVLNAAYSLYLGDPFTQAAVAVGSGATGTGLTGEIVDGGFTLADRRAGLNNIDFSWTDPRFGGFFYNYFGFADPYGLVADFDDGTATHNSACIVSQALLLFTWGADAPCGGGYGDYEVNLGGGDSGGPLFVNGQIAGVASYGLTFGSGLGDTDNFLNSTFGEFSGWTSTAYNAQWITQVTSVPEPASFALVGAGLLALVGFSKRRTRVS